jgi:hypothetical protein
LTLDLPVDIWEEQSSASLCARPKAVLLANASHLMILSDFSQSFSTAFPIVAQKRLVVGSF